MNKEQFQCISDEYAEKCVGKNITFTRENGSQETRKIIGLLLLDHREKEILHLDKATKYLGFQLDGKDRLFFNTQIDNITIE